MKTFLLLTLLSSFTPFPVKADVNMKDASYFKTWIDLEIRKDTHIFQLRRTYNSRSLHPGLFGFGWCSDFEKRLDLSRSDQISLKDCRLNTLIKFKKKKENLYESPNKETLEFKNNTYLRITAKKTLQKYNKLGKLTSLTDAAGDRLDLHYDPSGLLQKITFNNDSELNVKFTADRRHIQAITTKKNAGSRYRYEDQNLVHVTNSWQHSFVYQYDDLHNLTEIQSPDKTQEILTYDKEKDWILRVDIRHDRRHKCTEIFKFTRQGKNSDYSSSAEKRCAGKTITKTIYEFRHKVRADGSKYLDQVKVTQGNQIQRISYQNIQGPLNESQ